MIARRVHLILLLAICMLCVPALTRVMQQLAPVASASTQPSGFSRNCDSPPERVSGSPLLASAPLLSTPVAPDVPAPTLAITPVRAPADDALPALADVFRPTSLRAPPSSRA